jgi:2-amino-4-hydroxy-6-hydroxymethyldihydropteridine diphosphokinase
MPIIYIALGSNLGDREEQILRAVHEMRSFSRVKKISTLRETKPVGEVKDQPKFLNAIVELDTEYSPREVLEELLKIENEMGRTRGAKGGPREIDLDLVAYANEVSKDGDLEVPHPRMHERRFVLEPFAELNSKWVHPVLKKSVAEILETLPPSED